MEIKAISRKTLTPPEGYFLVSLRGKGKDDIYQPQKNIAKSTLSAALARICMISRRLGDYLRILSEQLSHGMSKECIYGIILEIR